MAHTGIILLVWRDRPTLWHLVTDTAFVPKNRHPCQSRAVRLENREYLELRRPKMPGVDKGLLLEAIPSLDSFAAATWFMIRIRSSAMPARGMLGN